MANPKGGIFWKAVGRTLFALVLFYGVVVVARKYATGKSFSESL